MWWNGDVSTFRKGVSKCSITLTKASASEVEGTAECPSLHDIDGKPATPLSNVKFFATTR